MKLISPNKNYKESYQKLIAGFKNDSLTPFTLKEDYTDFDGLVERLKANECPASHVIQSMTEKQIEIKDNEGDLTYVLKK